MTKDVLVSIKGTQFMEADEDSIEIITSGACHEKNGKWYVMYDEIMEGLDAVTHNTMKIQKDKIEVIKKGLVETRMTYECGKKHIANYLTPLGLIILGITTKSLDVEETEDRLRVVIEYSLEMNGQYVSGCRLEMNAMSRQDHVLRLENGQTEMI